MQGPHKAQQEKAVLVHRAADVEQDDQAHLARLFTPVAQLDGFAAVGQTGPNGAPQVDGFTSVPPFHPSLEAFAHFAPQLFGDFFQNTGVHFRHFGKVGFAQPHGGIAAGYRFAVFFLVFISITKTPHAQHTGLFGQMLGPSDFMPGLLSFRVITFGFPIDAKEVVKQGQLVFVTAKQGFEGIIKSGFFHKQPQFHRPQGREGFFYPHVEPSAAGKLGKTNNGTGKSCLIHRSLSH